MIERHPVTPQNSLIGPTRLRAMLGYAVPALIGLAILRRVIHAETPAGWLLLLMGGAGLGWEARRVWLDDRARRARIAAQAAREEVGAARRERAQRQRQERHLRRQTDANARVRQSSVMRAERDQVLAARQQEVAQRAVRQHRMDQAAARRLTLDANTFLAELEALFARRGLTLVRVAADDPCDLILTAASGAQSVARCLPTDHTAHAVDIQELDVWRRATGAETAYLIALAGFSPAAVRLTRSLPVTLVEAHLLAAWEEQ